MAYENIEALPQEVKSKLPQGAQQIFVAAFNGASSDGLSEKAAYDTAWNSVKVNYEEGSDGKWHPSSPRDRTAGDNPLGSMSQA
jgi:cation transport regulator